MTDERPTADSAPDVLDELRAELAAVEPSPEFATRVRQRIEGELDLLREELLVVAPSPEFAVKVRQRIDAAPGPARWMWLDWRWMVPAGAAAALLAAVLTWPRGGEVAPRPGTIVTAAQPAANPAVAVAPAAARRDRSGARDRSQASSRLPASVATSRSPAEPVTALEVITDQPAIIDEWIARLSMSAQPTRIAIAASEPLDVRAIEILPVEVAPVVVKWLVEPPPVVFPLPFQILRIVSAEMAERSAR